MHQSFVTTATARLGNSGDFDFYLCKAGVCAQQCGDIFMVKVLPKAMVGKSPGFMSIAQPSGFYWENPGFTRVIQGFMGFTG